MDCKNVNTYIWVISVTSRRWCSVLSKPETSNGEAKSLEMLCLYPCHETKCIQVVSYFLCFLLSHYWYKFPIKDGGSSSARGRLNFNGCPVQLMNCCLMKNNFFPFFPLPTVQKRVEMWDIPKQDVRRLIRHMGMQTIKTVCTQKARFSKLHKGFDVLF